DRIEALLDRAAALVGREQALPGCDHCTRDLVQRCHRHSHSIVPGGFDVMSYATLFTPGTSLIIRLEMRSSTSYGSRAQSAVMASSDVTARKTIGYSYVRSSPITPTVRTAGSTAKLCQISR